jgi:hypothetical protein
METRTPKKTNKESVIDVEAIILSGGKNSVTTKTVDALTPDEKMEMLGSAGKTLMLQAKKGLRLQAMKVRKDLLRLTLL